MPVEVLFSIITPSVGTRPLALAQAVRSVESAVEHAAEAAALAPESVEMLVGFDAVEGRRPDSPLRGLRYFVLPRPSGRTCGFGNHIRNILLRAATGRRVLFLDDDNILTPQALALHMRHMEADMAIGRVSTSRAFDVPFLPRPRAGRRRSRGRRHPPGQHRSAVPEPFASARGDALRRLGRRGRL